MICSPWDETEFPQLRVGLALPFFFILSTFSILLAKEMTTTKPKMKGIFKGFKYISQIFDEEKDDDIQIGFPTDVKHVAHIGWDGPTAVDNPSWMKEFSTTSAPLGPPTGDSKGEPEIKWVSEDSSTRRSNRGESGDAPKTSRRHTSSESDANPNESSSSSPRKKDPSSKPRRRNHSKDSSEGSVKSNRKHEDNPSGESAPPPNIPADPAKKSRRKKSKDLGAGRNAEGSTRSRPKPVDATTEAEPHLDPVPST